MRNDIQEKQQLNEYKDEKIARRASIMPGDIGEEVIFVRVGRQCTDSAHTPNSALIMQCTFVSKAMLCVLQLDNARCLKCIEMH